MGGSGPFMEFSIIDFLFWTLPQMNFEMQFLRMLNDDQMYLTAVRYEPIYST